MKAVKVIDNQPVLTDMPRPRGDGVNVKIVSASICGSDIHMIEKGAFGDHIIGHEFAGLTEDGRAVAIEPISGCGQCIACGEGYRIHCDDGIHVMGVSGDGGMAEYATVPAANIVELPTGLDIRIASLVEPLSVALHGLDRVRIRESDRILVIGAGPIGLSIAAALRGRGLRYDMFARYEHQKLVAEKLGAGLFPDGHYDVVMDAVGSYGSLEQAVQMAKPMGRIGLVGVGWDGIDLVSDYSIKELVLIPSTGFKCQSPGRNFDEAGMLLLERPDISKAMVTHRFPLDAVTEAFAAASDRSGGAIKVVFDIA